MKIFGHKSLYTCYLDVTTLILKDEKSIIELAKEINTFPNFSRLKPNKTKYEIAGIDVLNGLQGELCGMKCVNLNNETVIILGVYFSYNKSLEQNENFGKLIVKLVIFF